MRACTIMVVHPSTLEMALQVVVLGWPYQMRARSFCPQRSVHDMAQNSSRPGQVSGNGRVEPQEHSAYHNEYSTKNDALMYKRQQHIISLKCTRRVVIGCRNQILIVFEGQLPQLPPPPPFGVVLPLMCQEGRIVCSRCRHQRAHDALRLTTSCLNMPLAQVLFDPCATSAPDRSCRRHAQKPSTESSPYAKNHCLLHYCTPIDKSIYSPAAVDLKDGVVLFLIDRSCFLRGGGSRKSQQQRGKRVQSTGVGSIASNVGARAPFSFRFVESFALSPCLPTRVQLLAQRGRSTLGDNHGHEGV